MRTFHGLLWKELYFPYKNVGYYYIASYYSTLYFFNQLWLTVCSNWVYSQR